MSDNQNVILNQKERQINFMKEGYSTPVITVSPDTSIFETLKQMQTNFVKHIVVSAKNKPLGVVTERDINRFLENDKTARAIDEVPINHVMQKNVISLVDGLDDHFVQCASRMDTFKIGCVVLTNDNGELTGIVSRTDIAKAYAVAFGGKYIIKDFMSKKVVTCRKTDSLKFALDLINRNEVSRLVVTDENGSPIGLITTNTFLTHSDYFTKDQTRSREYLLPIKKGESLTVENMLTDEILTINQEEDLASAASLMVKNKINGIPVVDNSKNLVGVISKTDIVKAFTVAGPHEQLKSKYKEMY
ncbi:MAG TPA: CBS domain-containing protein [Nitrosopumilaceae archaeon]|nr:CBS domain-containing protein [Nitrosopumilaceae archaeon]